VLDCLISKVVQNKHKDEGDEDAVVGQAELRHEEEI
jgi:hypothetical protein